MSYNEKYVALLNKTPKLEVKKHSREVIFKVISVMCDNVYHLRFKKNGEGDFKMSGGGFALSNFQFKYEVHEIEWAADEGNWLEVQVMINSGVQLVESVKSR